MPKSEPLRVKIEGADGKTVQQKGKEIKAEDDGSYVIEFMDLELDVLGEAAPESSSSKTKSSNSKKKSKSSSAEEDPTSSSSDEDQTSSIITITQNLHWANQAPTTFAVFSATGVLVKSFVAIPQAALESFKALQIPHGTYYLKDLKSSYIKKAVR